MEEEEAEPDMLARMRLLKELMRVATQHRAIYCYVLLSVWIFLLIAGKFNKKLRDKQNI